MCLDGHPVTEPLLVPLNVAENNFSAKDQRAHRLFGVTECLLVHRVPDGEEPER